MNIKFWKKKETSQNKEKCGFDSATACPYSSDKDCKFDKTDCHLKNTTKKNNNTKQRFWLVVCFGILVYIITIILKKEESFAFQYSDFVYEILSGGSVSVIAGAIIAYLVDLPSNLKNYETSFINALASNGYLKSLTEDRLTKLRNDITGQLHKAKAPRMAGGLIKIDQRICELLREPYYTRYRQTVICYKKVNDNDYIVKEHSIDYKLINPYSVNKDATEYLTLSNLILSKNKPSNGNGAQPLEPEIKDIKITCIKDGGETVEYKLDEHFELKYNFDINSKEEYYDAEIYLDAKDKSLTEQKRGIRIDFKDNIVVHLEYKLVVPVKDKCFTKRLQHPVKNFRLDYACRDIDGQLFGQIFGTELKQSDFAIKYPTDKSISLEAFDWLLPKNGAIVVLC